MSAAGTAAPALELAGLTVAHGSTVVVRGVSLTVPQGAVVALLGANGAGKTTLMRAAAGLLRASRGTVRLDGRDVTARPADLRSRAGLCHVPEGRGIFRGLTVRENLQLQVPKARAAEAVTEAVEFFPQLREKLKVQAGTLSGGQQQMLALAAGHLRRPTVLLVDEPSLGLAPLVVDEIFEFLARRAAAGTAILIVDQFVDRTLAIADTAHVLRRGEIVHSAPADELDQAEVFDHYAGTDRR
ncbi:ABC transporter ATP-binding protein [Actinomadura roseirufa]|uniref:ABC transporter ATP-binding protein n=1 Tax=Actinomadura roseirufa TaxID=2094049 RepID=UPI0010417993|nr:ABC transporter ATP-binding protein [Actinomadura roseirufa]